MTFPAKKLRGAAVAVAVVHSAVTADMPLAVKKGRSDFVTALRKFLLQLAPMLSRNCSRRGW
jgi:hypothetical protein